MEETINDTPRLHTNLDPLYKLDFGYDYPEESRSLYQVVLDHARAPGVFDYTLPQTYYAIFPDANYMNHVEIDGNNHRGLKISNWSS